MKIELSRAAEAKWHMNLSLVAQKPTLGEG
jgi:hypothetical protein